MDLKAAAGAILAAGAAATAFAADPYPDQRGALPAAELQAAGAALRAMPGADAKMSLAASGRRAAGAYVVFAAAAEKPAPILGLQRRVLCTNSAADPQWSCAPHTLYRFEQGRLRQTFAYSAKGVAEDPTMPFKIIGYFGQCVGQQYQALIGFPLPGGMPAVAEVVQEAKRVVVTAGAGDTFELAEAKAEAEQTCAFTLQKARIARPSAVAAANLQPTPSALEEPAQAEPKPAAPAAAPASGWRHAMARLAGVAVGLNVVAGLLALGVPFVARRMRGRRAAAMMAVLGAAATVAFAIAVVVLLKLAASTEGGSLRLVTLVTLLAVASGAGWGIVGALAQRAAQRPKNAA